MNLAKYNKTIVAAIGALGEVIAALPNGTPHWVHVVIAVLAALGVYQIPNKPVVAVTD